MYDKEQTDDNAHKVFLHNCKEIPMTEKIETDALFTLDELRAALDTNQENNSPRPKWFDIGIVQNLFFSPKYDPTVKPIQRQVRYRTFS